MNGRASPAGSDPSGFRLRTYEIPGAGQVVQLELWGRQEPECWQRVRDALREEVRRRSPDHLVLDVRGLDGFVGSAFLGGLVAGAIEMERLGKHGRTRIVATGEIATKLQSTLPLCKLEPILGAIHGDLASALLGEP
jgi:hypothetical protein